MSEMRMGLEAFAAGELDYAGLQRKIAEELAVGCSVEDALAELHAICESDGMSQGLYNVLRRAITRVGDGDDTDPFPAGTTRPKGETPSIPDKKRDEPTDPDLPAMFTHPEQLLPDELPPDPLRTGPSEDLPAEIVLPDDEAMDALRAATPTKDPSLGADALITGVHPQIVDDTPMAHRSTVEDQPPAGLPEAGDVIADRYVVQSILGRGGMAVVYRVLDRCREACESDAATIALKMLKPELQEHEGSDRRLLLEALQGQRLNHSNLVRILDLGSDRGRAFVTMELLEGELLRSALTRRTPDGFSGDEALEIIAGIGRGLAYLHRHGYVHSDLKPGNVFLASDGQAKLLDFGLSRRPGRALEPILDGGDVPARTPAYASPQILRGEAPGYHDDVFALACVASEILTGRHPFGRVPADQARERKLKPPRVRGLTAYQKRALDRALSFRATRRPEDADAFMRSMGLIEEQPRERSPGFLQGALLGLGAGLLLTLAIISPDGPLQRLMSRTPGEQPVADQIPSPQRRSTPDRSVSAPASEPVRTAEVAGRDLSIGGTFSPDTDSDGDSDPMGSEPLADRQIDDTPTAPETDADGTEASLRGLAGSDVTQSLTGSAGADELSPGAREPSLAVLDATSTPVPSPGRLAFDTGVYEVDEGSAVLIARVVRSDGTDGEIAFRWRTLGGSAAPDEDFVAADWQRTSMADGQTSARIFIPLVNDGLGEPPESFHIELADAEGGVTLADETRVRVIILDDDGR